MLSEPKMREILAEEMERAGLGAFANQVRAGNDTDPGGSVAMRAMKRVAEMVEDTYTGADAADKPDAMAATESGDLLADTTHVIRMAYIAHTGSTAKAQKVAEAVLLKVMEHYERAAAAQGTG